MIDLLLKEPIGVIVACGAFSSLQEGLIDLMTLKEFMKNCLEAYSEEQVQTTYKLIIQFGDVATGNRPKNVTKRKIFLFACTKRTPTLNQTNDFSTVMEVGTMNAYLIKDSSVADGHASFISNPEPTDPALEDAIDNLNTKKDIFRANARLGGNPLRPLFWIAPSNRISFERQSNLPENLGDAIRDLLGLIHFEEDIPLVEFRIPSNQLLNLRHARPTFADAITHRRFRVHPDGSRARKRSGWGCTAHLRRLADGDDNIDGAPERVVEPTDFNKHLGTTFKFAGGSTTVRGNTKNDNDAAFATHICRSTNLSNLKGFLLNLLS